jgi:hypothetical protein
MDKLMDAMQAHTTGLERMAVQLGSLEARLQGLEPTCMRSLIIGDDDESKHLQHFLNIHGHERHRTAPQSLLRDWPCFAPLLRLAAMDPEDGYVRRAEHRDTLSLYDRYNETCKFL